MIIHPLFVSVAAFFAIWQVVLTRQIPAGFRAIFSGLISYFAILYTLMACDIFDVDTARTVLRIGLIIVLLSISTILFAIRREYKKYE